MKIQVFNFSIVVALIFVASTKAGIPPIASVCSLEWTPSTPYEIFNELIRTGSGYNKDVRPTNTTADPTILANTTVAVNMFVAHIGHICEVDGKFKVQLLFRQFWNDPRLAYETTSQYQNQCNQNQRPEKLSLPDSMIDEIWTPDLYFIQELDSMKHGPLRPNRLVKVSPNGDVLMSQKISLTLACPQFANSDLKRKECDMSMESYGHSLKELPLEWKEESSIYFEKNLFVPKKYKLETVTPLKCDTFISTSGISYSCIKAKFVFSK